MGIINKDLLRFYGWSDEPTIEECAKKAYMDLCRTMKYYSIEDEDDRNKRINAYKDEIYKCMSEEINQLENSIEEEKFDEWHENTLKSIMDISNNFKQNGNSKIVSAFYYGQSQKWLNMTLKNMLIYEMFCDDAKWIKEKGKVATKMIEQLHVPVDSIIIDAAAKMFEDKIKIPKLYDNNTACKDRKYGKYGKSSAQPWSRWDKKDYIKFQESLRQIFKKKNDLENFSCPIEWELRYWPKYRDEISNTAKKNI